MSKDINFDAMPDLEAARSGVKGKTPLEVTEDEVLAFARKDMGFGFHREVLVDYLSFENAKEFLNKEFLNDEDSEKKWKALPLVREIVLAEASEYSRFGWGKIIDHRGISASRTVAKMRAWLFLLGDKEMMDICDDEGKYMPYGAPILYEICKKYDWSMPDMNESAGDEDGTIGKMIGGLPCSSSCSGCSH